MDTATHQFEIHKKVLDNGLTVLVRPTYATPEVIVQMWYNVGAKHEGIRERGMAHLIEHMIFKGTDKLSESDINLITHKLAGSANAFTSHDYTSYVFKFPRAVWYEALPLFAECMHHTTFNSQMLASELHTVIQEMKMYKDDYQETLVERMLAVIFSEHPYHYPIIGYKQDLWNLSRDDLYAFYQKHYHAANAMLMIVGDVEISDAFAKAKEYLGVLSAQKARHDRSFFFNEDIAQTTVTLRREVENPWCFYSYIVPGLQKQKNHLFDMLALLIANGRSSRLHEKLINETKLAVYVSCFVYELFEKGLFFICVQPKDRAAIGEIEKIIVSELARIASDSIEDWELQGVKKMARMDYLTLLESIEKQADVIGSAYLAIGDERYIDNYLKNVTATTTCDLKETVARYFKPSLQHHGYLLPADEQEKKELLRIQHDADQLDQEILKKYRRTIPIEPGNWVHRIAEKSFEQFVYPRMQSVVLENGLEVLYSHNPNIPQISMVLGLKADYLYEPDDMSGVSLMIGRLLLEGTRAHSARELNKLLESEGIELNSSSGIITIKCLQENAEKALIILNEIVTQSTFGQEAIDKIRQKSLVELKEFWDTPAIFINQLAKELIYQDHPYGKNILGNRESIAKLGRDVVFDFAQTYLSPQQATLVVFGDLTRFPDFPSILEKHLGRWKGKSVPDLKLPSIQYSAPKTVNYEINRDQVVLGFVAPSLSRVDKNFEKLNLLDVVVTGGATGSMSSRLFALREQTGLFYTISGSLTYGAAQGEGMMFIKTIVSTDAVQDAEKMVKKVIENVGEKGVNGLELRMAANALLNSSISMFESSMKSAYTFLYLKKCGLEPDLFDKRGELLSIIKLDEVNDIACKFCKQNNLSVIRVGRRCW